MLTIKRILFPTDLTPCAEAAFAHAAHLAARYDAELIVLRVIQPLDREIVGEPMTEREVADQLHLAAAQVASAARAPHRTRNVPIVHRELEAADPVMGIIECADDEDVDLIVMGTHGRRGMDRLLLGSVAEEVARLASCPVLTVREQKADRPARAVERILVPIDYSDHSAVALSYARELAADYGARLDLVHVVEEVVLPVLYGIEPVTVATDEVRERAQQGLYDLLARTPGAHVPAEAHVTFGHPVNAILDAASEYGTDLIVLATHGRTGLPRLLMGSIAEKVVRMASCPVFTVKSFGKRLFEMPDVETHPNVIA